MKAAIAVYVLVILLFGVVAVSYDAELLQMKVDKYSRSEKAIGATEELSDYFKDRGEMPADFNEEEAAHMKDVKRLLQFLQAALLIGIVVLVALVTMLETRKLMLYGGLITLALVILSSAIPFHLLFIMMHHSFFPQGNWSFPAESTIIQYYPQELFISYACSIGTTVSLIAAASIIVSFIIERG